MNRFNKTFVVIALPLALPIAVPTPPGESKSAKTKMLEAGAKLLQSNYTPEEI